MEELCARSTSSYAHKGIVPSFSRLLKALHPPQDPGFQTLAAQRWATYRAGPWSNAVVSALIDSQSATLQPAGLRTLDKCGAISQPSILRQ